MHHDASACKIQVAATGSGGRAVFEVYDKHGGLIGNAMEAWQNTAGQGISLRLRSIIKPRQPVKPEVCTESRANERPAATT